jgi:hypothetical protein
MTRIQRIRIATVVAAALAGGAAWYLFGPKSEDAAGPVANVRPERKVLYWHDPMVPGFKSDKPGKSPFMDMELVPVYEDEAGEQGGTPVVTVRAEVVQSLGVRTYKVERAARPRRLVTEGYLFRDEARGGLSVLVDIFDRDADWVRAGLPAEIRVLGLADRRFEAQVASVGADLDVGARSLKARVRLKQSDPALKPNMFATVTIEAPPAGKKLFVPREALIRTATRTAVVRALDEGRFQPAEVVAGAEYGDWVEIVKGVAEGDTVVTSGQFLIDSESSLRASFQRMESVEK